MDEESYEKLKCKAYYEELTEELLDDIIESKNNINIKSRHKVNINTSLIKHKRIHRKQNR